MVEPEKTLESDGCTNVLAESNNSDFEPFLGPFNQLILAKYHPRSSFAPNIVIVGKSWKIVVYDGCI